jgi:hypothetical protein
MLTWLILLLASACAPRNVEPTPVPVTQVSPSDADLARFVDRLRAYHPSEDCAALTADLADPTDTLTRAVAEVSVPPWVGLTAGTCTMRMYPEAQEALIKSWFTEDQFRGLGRALARELPSIPDESAAVRISTIALTSPHADVAREAIATDPRPALRALLQP